MCKEKNNAAIISRLPAIQWIKSDLLKVKSARFLESLG